jgi:hypothetical protein
MTDFNHSEPTRLPGKDHGADDATTVSTVKTAEPSHPQSSFERSSSQEYLRQLSLEVRSVARQALMSLCVLLDFSYVPQFFAVK